MTIVQDAGHLLTDHGDVVADIKAVLAGGGPRNRGVRTVQPGGEVCYQSP